MARDMIIIGILLPYGWLFILTHSIRLVNIASICRLILFYMGIDRKKRKN